MTTPAEGRLAALRSQPSPAPGARNGELATFTGHCP